jgi:crossover junction endodeoxyribonuclease RuvC
VLGIDPGLVDTGFGLLEAGPAEVAVLDVGVISTGRAAALEARLHVLHGTLQGIIAARAPALLVVEDLYAEYRFPRTALLMAHARGVIYLAARQFGVPIIALSPAEVKRAVTGNGAAAKGQVQLSIQTLLGLNEPPRPSHVADALGLAVTGLARTTGWRPGRSRR